MKLSRPSRFVAALVALFGVLFMQFAVASYACPGHQTGQADEPVAISAGAGIQYMEDCEGMDLEQPGLCHAHDQAGTQSLDKPDLPQARPFFSTGSALTLLPPDAVYLPSAGQFAEVQLTRSIAPPLSIQNCCFRI